MSAFNFPFYLEKYVLSVRIRVRLFRWELLKSLMIEFREIIIGSTFGKLLRLIACVISSFDKLALSHKPEMHINFCRFCLNALLHLFNAAIYCFPSIEVDYVSDYLSNVMSICRVKAPHH